MQFGHPLANRPLRRLAAAEAALGAAALHVHCQHIRAIAVLLARRTHLLLLQRRTQSWTSPDWVVNVYTLAFVVLTLAAATDRYGPRRVFLACDPGVATSRRSRGPGRTTGRRPPTARRGAQPSTRPASPHTAPAARGRQDRASTEPGTGHSARGLRVPHGGNPGRHSRDGMGAGTPACHLGTRSPTWESAAYHREVRRRHR